MQLNFKLNEVTLEINTYSVDLHFQVHQINRSRETDVI